MDKLKLAAVLLFLTLLFTALRRTDDDLLQTIIDKLSFYTEGRPQEKIYLHMDRPFYSAGDDMWFKSYLVNAENNHPDSISRTVYVDLMNSDHEIIQSRILYSPNGSSYGDFHLSDSLSQGNYLIRAYTNYMKNAGEDFFFHREFALFKKDSESTKNVAPAGGSIDLQFFPEGGNLVGSSAPNRIAFKATAPDGKPISVEGEIIDSHGNVLRKFESAHDGMGLFSMFTLSAENYRARITKPSGENHVYDLPRAADKGFVMQTYDAGKNIRVIVYNNYILSEGKVSVHLVAQSHGNVCFAASADLKGPSFFMNIPKSKFPHGIGHITLFDGTGKPHCERLIFVSRNSNLSVNIRSDRSNYQKRGKVELEINSAYPGGNPASGDFSISVYDKSKVKSGDSFPLSIEAYLHLTSDLRGYIHNPGYYFKDTLHQTKDHLDLLLMTQGWRRFSWKEVLGDTLPAIRYFNENGIPVSGKVQRTFSKKAARAKVKIMTQAGNFVSADSDSLGRFYSSDLVYFDSTDMIIQTENVKGNNTEFKFFIDPFNPPFPGKYKFTAFEQRDARAFLDQSARNHVFVNALKFTEGTTLLGAVEVKAKKISDSPLKSHLAGSDKIDMSKLPHGSNNIFRSLQSRVAGLEVRGTPPNMYVLVRGSKNVVYLLNGSMRIDADFVNSMNPQDVESIEILKGGMASVYGSGANAVISINLKEGGGTRVTPGLHHIKYPGYNVAREFYTPKYDVADDSHKLEDIRTTLYWNPKVKTESNGKSLLSFFASDVASEYEVVIEGITVDGYPGWSTATFKVD